MKQFLDYKKLFSFLAVSLFLGSFLFAPAYLYAQTAAELKSKIEQKNEDIAKLEAEIKQFQAELDTLGKQKNSLNGSIKELDLTRKKLVADISVTQNKIERTNLKIQSLGSQITTKESSIDNAHEALAVDIRRTNELEESSLVANILSEDDFSLIWNDLDNMVTVRESIRGKIAELRQVKGELEDTRDETIDARNELSVLKSKLADQKKIVEQNTTEKNKLLAETKNSEVNYQKLVATQMAKKLALEQEVRSYESQLKFILDPKSLPSDRPLSWPLDYIFVTSPFGPRSSGFHSGTDFRAPIGTPVKAMADGVVGGSGNTDATCPGASFGKWVFIKYGNGLSSTYGHLSLTKAEKGERVTRGQIVGYSGNTGSSTGPHLHVSVYAPTDSAGNPGAEVKTIPSKSCAGQVLTQPIAATNAYLDPMKYLPKL